MDQNDKIIDRLNLIDYRLRVIEKYMDHGFIDRFKGEQGDVDYIRIAVLQDMRKEIKGLRIDFDQHQGRAFYKPNHQQ